MTCNSQNPAVIRRRRSSRVGLGTYRKPTAALVAVVLLASACAGGDGTDGDASDDLAATGSTVETDNTDGAGTTAGDDPAADGADGSDGSGAGDAGSTDGEGSAAEPYPGFCRVGEVNIQPFYAVTNIPEDDPDGGLNVRTDWDGGDVVATLPENTVVFVEGCHRRDDGAIWFAVYHTPDVGGWANAAFLTAEIPASAPTFGGTDAATKVEAVLGALAGQDWEAAAAELTVPDSEYAPVAALLHEGGDLAAQLEAYCATRICDAPYTVTAVRGAYMEDRDRAEVDVEFTYPQGTVVETFERVGSGDSFTLDSLPGRSVLGLQSDPAPVSDVVEDRVDADAGLYEAAEEVRQALLSETGPRIPAEYIPTEGIAVSTDAYIEPAAAQRVKVTEAELSAGGAELRIWGYADGIGTAIVDTVDGHFSGYRRSLALLDPDVVGVDRRVGLGNTIANSAEVFPDARVVEFHRRGRGELSDFNWSSVRLALEERDGQWKLVAITSDSWTI